MFNYLLNNTGMQNVYKKELLNEASVQMVCDGSEASLFAKHSSDTRQL